MQRVQAHLAVFVSASDATQSLRHDLINAGIAPAALASHLRGLRRGLVLGEYERVTLCIALDRATLDRHGPMLRRLLEDRRSFPTTITAIGWTLGQALTAEAASLGCDVYLDDHEQVVDAVCFFERSTTVQNARCTMSLEPDCWASSFIEQPVADCIANADRHAAARNLANDQSDDTTTKSRKQSKRRSEQPRNND